MLNRDVFQTPPEQYRLANQGVAKISVPPAPDGMETLRSELSTFVCDGAYANGLSRILNAYLAAVGRGGSAPAVWISGFFGSGKSHLASMLAALWTNLTFEDGATAEGLIQHIPDEVKSLLKELRIAAQRMGGVLAAGDTLGHGPSDPAEATLNIILRAVGLPTDLRAATVAFWLADLGILDDVRGALGATFDRDIRAFMLSPRFADAVLKAKPELAADARALSQLLKAQFPEPPPVTVDTLETMVRDALMLGREEIPLTLIVLDEVQQFIRQDPALTLKIQTITERLSGRFDGRVLLVGTGQQALSDVKDLQKLLDRFPVQIALGEADVDSVIRKTVLRKKPETESFISTMLKTNAGEISRHLRGSKLAHTVHDDPEAVLDWPLLPSRRRVWERILRELDRTGLGGTLRGQLRTTLDAAKTYAPKPLGTAVPVDFLYSRFADEAFNAGLLPAETRNHIEALRGGEGDDPLKARILMLVYMLGRIAGEADLHGVRAQPETIADLLTEDLAGEPDLRRKVPLLLDALRDEGGVIEVGGEWRLQTKESAEWEAAYRSELAAQINDQTGISRVRREFLDQAIEGALAGSATVSHGLSKESRKVHRLRPNEKAPADGVPLYLWSGWDEDIAAVEKEIAAAPPTDAAVHLLINSHRPEDLSREIAVEKAAESVVSLKGVPTTDAGREAREAMALRGTKAHDAAVAIIKEAVQNARVVQAGGAVIAGAPSDAVKTAAANALIRLYPQFADADHAGWSKVLDRAKRKDPDAIKAVDHAGAPETHLVCKAILADLGPGRRGSDIRSKFTATPYGWPQDAIDGALMVLANAGQLRVTGEDGKAASLPELPRAKMGVCTFRSETTVITLPQRLAVRGLLQDAGIPFEKEQEAFVLAALLDRLENAAKAAGGPSPAPASAVLPDAATLRGLSGNDLLAELAHRASDLRQHLKDWKLATQTIQARLPKWLLAERLVGAGADEQVPALEAVRNARSLIADPDPVPPIVAAATDALRNRLNVSYDTWEKEWQSAEKRLAQDPAWGRLSPDQKHRIREANQLLPATKPTLETPEAVAEALQKRRLSEWDNMTKALSARVYDALAEAAAEWEPEARPVTLPAGLIRTEADLDTWLTEVRTRIVFALADGPVLPKV